MALWSRSGSASPRAPNMARVQHVTDVLGSLPMSSRSGGEYSAPSELPSLLKDVSRCRSLTRVNLCGHGGGSKTGTTLALIDAIRINTSIRVFDLRQNGFGTPAMGFALDEWRRCAVLEQLMLFSVDPRQPDAQAPHLIPSPPRLLLIPPSIPASFVRFKATQSSPPPSHSSPLAAVN